MRDYYSEILYLLMGLLITLGLVTSLFYLGWRLGK